MASQNHVLTPEYLAQDRYPEVLIACSISFTICIICIILRLISVRLARNSMWLDDYAAISAGVFAIVNFVFIVLWKQIGFGKHIEAAVLLDPTAPEKFLKRTVIQEILYIMAITSARFSILAFLWKIFRLLRTRWVLIGLMVVSGAWAIAISLGSLLSCVPVGSFWNLSITEKTCIDHYRFYVGVGVTNMIIDFSIAFVPIPYVVKLQVSTSQKLMVICTFLVAGVTCFISAVRLSIIVHNVSFTDPTWGSVDVMKWSGIEMFCSIISVCLPTYLPLLRWVHARWKGIRRAQTVKTGNIDGTNESSDTEKHIMQADIRDTPSLV